MSEPWVPEIVVAEAQRRRRKRRRWLLFIVAAILLAAITPVGLYYLRKHQSERALEDAIAETNRLDPGWRLVDLVKRQSALPVERNAAVHITAAHAILANWKLDAKDATTDKKLVPQFQLDQQIVAALRKSREPYLPARVEAVKAIPLKTGWYPRIMSFDGSREGGITSVQVAKVGKYLHGLAMLQCEDGNYDDAWQTTLAVLATGRSYGDLSGTMALLFRSGFGAAAATSFERCLAQGAIADPLLAEAMKALADEAGVPLFYNALCCERAWGDELLTRVEDGRLEYHQLTASNIETSRAEKIAIEIRRLVAGGTFKGEHAWILRFDSEALALAKLPHAAMQAKLKELEQKLREEGPARAAGADIFGLETQFAQNRAKLELRRGRPRRRALSAKAWPLADFAGRGGGRQAPR